MTCYLHHHGLQRMKKNGIEAGRKSGTFSNFYSFNRYLLIPSMNKVFWEIQRFEELVGGIYNVVEETER